MKHWQETERILHRLIRLASEGRPAALAVVVRIEGSAYRRPGARLLIEEGGHSMGSVSGGCLEEDVRLIAQDAMGSGRPSLRHYETGSDDTKVWGLGLGCNGTVDVFVYPVTTDAQRDVWRRVHERLQGDRPFQVAIATAGPDAGRAWIVGEDDAPAGAEQVFTESFVPPPRLVVCGAGDDAQPLVSMAGTVGWRVVMADHRPAYLTAERFPAARERYLLRPTDDLAPLRLGPGTYAVIMTHSFKHDRDWARRLLEADLPYVGLLGPRQRAETILAETGSAREVDKRLYGPVGLDLGADGPEQVALSIVAELMAVWSHRDARHLRTKELAVHA